MRGKAVCLWTVLLLLQSMPAMARNIRLQVHPLYQTDYPRALFIYGGTERSVRSSGCGASCIAMVVGYLAPHVQQTPETQLLLACESGLYYGKGLNFKAMEALLAANGLMGQWMGNGPKQIRRALRSGYPIIAYMGPGTFTSTGHYIVLSGMDRNDRVWVIDPNSEKRSMRWYPLEMIFEEVGNQHAFLVCRTMDIH